MKVLVFKPIQKDLTYIVCFMKEEIDFSLKTCESDKTLSLRVPSWMKDKLASVARSKGTTMSCVALALLKHGIMERVNGNI